MKSWIVLKYGGTSVSTLPRWRHIANRIRELQSEHRVWVVISALAGHTNKLEAALAEAVSGGAPDLESLERDCRRLAAEAGLNDASWDKALEVLAETRKLLDGARLTGEASPRLRARVLSAGERISTHLGAALLAAWDLPARWTDATQLLESERAEGETDANAYLEARVPVRSQPERAEASVNGASLVLTQGFIARNTEGETCLLGRGGSDTSAALMAAMLNAEFLEIWSDVHGIFTADPSRIPTARLIRHLGYREAQEMAALGAKVLHPRCVGVAARAGVPLVLRSTDDPGREGTRVESASEDHPVVTAVTCRRGVTLLSISTLDMWEQPGYLARLFAPFEALGFSIDLLATSESAVSLTLDAIPGGLDGRPFADLLTRLGRMGRVRVVRDCAVVSILGRRIRAALSEIGSALEVFRERPVHLLTDSAEDLNLSFVVDQPDADTLVEKLHTRLFAGRGDDPRLGPTWDMLQAPGPPPPTAGTAWWRGQAGELIALCQREGASYVYHLETVRERASALRRELAAVGGFYYSMKANSHPDILRAIAASGFGMECVSLEEVRRAREVLGPDVPVVFTPNFCPVAEYGQARELGAQLVIDGPAVLSGHPDLFRQSRLGVRLDPGRGLGHHDKVRTAGSRSKFGHPVSQLEELAEAARAAEVTVVGLHAHVGSGILDPGAWSRIARTLLEAREQFPEVAWLCVGGGLGVPETPGQPPLDLGRVQESLAPLAAALSGVELRMEPGRYLVSEAGVLIAPVTQVREKSGVRYAGISTGMNSLLRPALYGAWHTIHNLSRLEESPTGYWQVVGPICESGDILGRDRWIPDPRPGDVLLIENAGAYGFTMSSRYNLREPAREVII